MKRSDLKRKLAESSGEYGKDLTPSEELAQDALDYILELEDQLFELGEALDRVHS